MMKKKRDLAIKPRKGRKKGKAVRIDLSRLIPSGICSIKSWDAGPDSVAVPHCVPFPCGHCFPQPIFCIYLEEPIRLPRPHRINFSVRLSIRLFVCSSVCLSIIYENTLNFHIGIKIRVSTWSFLSVVHPLRIPIPMYEKKVWVQHKNLYKITYCLRVLPMNFCTMYHKPMEH